MNNTVHLFQWNLSIIGCRSIETKKSSNPFPDSQTAATCTGCKPDDSVFYWCCSDVTPHHPISDLSTLERIVNNKHLPVSSAQPPDSLMSDVSQSSLGRWQLVVRGHRTSGGVFAQKPRYNFLKLWELLRPIGVKTTLKLLETNGHRQQTLYTLYTSIIKKSKITDHWMNK